MNLTIKELIEANASRVRRWHPGGIHDWTPLEWAGAMAGETGEACNAAKKLKRLTDGIESRNTDPARHFTKELDARGQVAKEVADAIIYGVLLVQSVDLDLEVALAEVFNAKSKEYGFPERIGQPPDTATMLVEARTLIDAARTRLVEQHATGWNDEQLNGIFDQLSEMTEIVRLHGPTGGCHHCDETAVGRECWWCNRIWRGEAK